jgi:hypothetical protein
VVFQLYEDEVAPLEDFVNLAMPSFRDLSNASSQNSAVQRSLASHTARRIKGETF